MDEREKLQETSKEEEGPEITRTDWIRFMKINQFDWEDLWGLYTSSEEQPQLDQDSSGSGSQVDQ